MKAEIKKFWKADKRELRKFGLTLGIALIVIGTALFFLKGQTNYISLAIFDGIGFLLAFFGLVLPVVLRVPYLIWMTFGLAIGLVVTKIVLGLIFYTLFTMIGIVLRILRKDILEKRFSDGETYWSDKKLREINYEFFTKQF